MRMASDARSSSTADVGAAPLVGTTPREDTRYASSASDDISRSAPTAYLRNMQTDFGSRAELLAYVTEFGLVHGYVLVIHKSNLPRGQVWLRCDMGGAAREAPAMPAEPKRKRRTSQLLANCPFQLHGRRVADGSWVLNTLNDTHSHEPATHTEALEAHPKARRLTNAQKRIVVELTDQGIRPGVIVERLKEKFPEKPLKVQDIYNARNFIRRERLVGRVPYPEALEINADENEDDTSSFNARIAAARARGRASRIPRVNKEEMRQLMDSAYDAMDAMPPSQQYAFFTEMRGLLERYTQNANEVTSGESEPAAPRGPRDAG